MDTETVWVGLDLGLTRTHVCVVDHVGVPLHELDCETKLQELRSALSDYPADHIGMIAVEAAGFTGIIRKLRGAGLPVVMFESRKASKFLALRRSKTDASDARGLADLGRLGRNTVSQVYLKSPECERLRRLLSMRRRLVKMLIAGEGALRTLLNVRSFKQSRRPESLRRQVEPLLAQLRIEEDFDPSSDVEPLLEMCERLRVHLKKLNAELESQAKASEVCRLLMEVPGVGPLCSLHFYCAVEDPNRFRRASDIGAYLGLVPRRYQSGEVSRTLGITKTGNKFARTHLVTAATTFGRHAPDCALKDWYIALRARLGSKRARVAMARKLAVILITMWKNGARFRIEPSQQLPKTESVI